ncbi:hypothetical protein SK128_017202 [Halocaridina rubra]|uniref:Uncharacterized protein n=1 Tax=Halocaridina rubra TaxID=373956 RepID=A0AAN8ZVI7_HALRR
MIEALHNPISQTGGKGRVNPTVVILPGLTMPRGARDQVASPILLQCDFSGTPLFEDADDSMDVVLYDTTIEYVPRNKTRIRTALGMDSTVDNLKIQLFNPDNLLFDITGPKEDSVRENEDEEEFSAKVQASGESKSCYEKTVELESPTVNHSRISLCSHEGQLEYSHQDTAAVSMLRALRCFEGDQLSDRESQYYPTTLEVQRTHNQRQSAIGQNRKGYSLIPKNPIIEY